MIHTKQENITREKYLNDHHISNIQCFNCECRCREYGPGVVCYIDGKPKVIKITGVPGLTEKTNKYGPYDVPAAHIFKIRNGMIYEVEAVFYMTEHGIKNGWE